MNPRILTIALIFSGALHAAESGKAVLLVHGGYAEDKPELTPAIKQSYCNGMKKAMTEGYALIKAGKSSLDAVQAAVRILEDDPEFNAGRGAVFTHDGKNELDASLMEGKTKRAGAVAGVTTIKNPILAARAVMEKTRHLLLISKGAEEFAKKNGLEIVNPKYFWTKRRWEQLQQDLKKEAAKTNSASFDVKRSHDHGTVGSVAMDSTGTLSAATSTGGLSNKMHGRVGDSPIIGAGTYADNDGTAVSCTGEGEFFIRFHVASEINDLVKYKNMSVKDATHHVLFNELSAKAGEGGIIALDKNGNFATDENSEGMLRGYVAPNGEMHAFVYDQECPKS